MLPRVQGDGNGAALADAGVTTAQWQAALRAVQAEFAWQFEQITLSRTGPGSERDGPRSSAGGSGIPSGRLAGRDRDGIAARPGCGRDGRSCWPCAQGSRRRPQRAARARPPQPRQSTRRPCRHRTARLWGGPLRARQAAPDGAPTHCAGRRLPSAGSAQLVWALYGGAAALKIDAHVHCARIVGAAGRVRWLEPAGARRGAAAVTARSARATHPLAERGAIAAPSVAVFERGEVAPGTDRGAHGGRSRRATAAAVVVVIEKASPPADSHPRVHAGEPRVLRHGRTAAN